MIKNKSKIQMSKSKQCIFFIIIVFLVLIFDFGFRISALADSVYNAEAPSPYSNEKAHKIGDIINIIVLESTSAQNQAGTNTDIKDDLGVKFTHSIARLNPIISGSNQADGTLANKYKGTGKTSRTSSVQARIAAWVTDVLPNGNLFIKGKHKVSVNDDIQEVTITGIIRPKDISGTNTVFSYQVANAEVAVTGKGVVAEAESPGWITRILNWLF